MAEMTFDFSGKSALVTGAGSGIGAAIARELARSGAHVVVADMSAPDAEKICGEIHAAGGRCAPFVLDVSDAGACERLTDFAVKAAGRLDFAVNNAGIGGPMAPVGDYPLEGWRHVIDVNLHGVFYGMRYQIPAMLRTGGGAIVNMSSILGSVGFANAAAYVAAKHAVLGLTKTAAIEYAGKGIRINAIGPGFIDTPMLSKNLTPEMMAGIAALHPVGRLGKSEEVSALTCFLLSERAAFINGSYHLIDGGYTSP